MVVYGGVGPVLLLLECSRENLYAWCCLSIIEPALEACLHLVFTNYIHAPSIMRVSISFTLNLIPYLPRKGHSGSVSEHAVRMMGNNEDLRWATVGIAPRGGQSIAGCLQIWLGSLLSAVGKSRVPYRYTGLGGGTEQVFIYIFMC